MLITGNQSKDLEVTAKHYELADFILAYAKENYGYFGWDIVFECYDRDDIAFEHATLGITTRKAALDQWRWFSKLKHEQRREAMAA